jgi:hypothetical protein
MWIDKDDVFTDDKVQEFKNSHPNKRTHIRTLESMESPHSLAPTCSHLLLRHTSTYLSSDGHDELAFEYPAGAYPDSPSAIQPVQIVDTKSMQPLDPTAPS